MTGALPDPANAESSPSGTVLVAGQGSKGVVSAEGWDAKEAIDAVASLIESGFHEED